MKNLAQRTDRVREQRARRALRRQHNYLLRKSRSESDSYWIVDLYTNTVVAGDFTLGDVEAWLQSDDASVDEEACCRCDKDAPAQKSDAFLEWEALVDADHNLLGVVCPGCITPEEQQQLDEAFFEGGGS